MSQTIFGNKKLGGKWDPSKFKSRQEYLWSLEEEKPKHPDQANISFV